MAANFHHRLGLIVRELGGYAVAADMTRRVCGYCSIAVRPETPRVGAGVMAGFARAPRRRDRGDLLALAGLALSLALVAAATLGLIGG